MIFNLARGLNIHCGCFSTSTEGTGNVSMAWYVLRDGLFLGRISCPDLPS